ncbi:hypothetical protein Tco_1512715 [Tanacetum coccineum]
MGNTDKLPVVKADPKDWFKKLEKPPTPDPKWNECKIVNSKPTQKWLSDLAKAEKTDSSTLKARTFYQKKLNISIPLTHKAGITDLEPYTTYSNPQGVIYLDKLERNRLMCSHELYKFSDGTLISVWDKLKDKLNNLEMGYTSVMPRRRWGNLEKKWSRIMVKDNDRQLLETRLMRGLKKFVGRREYEEDLRLLQWTI